MRAPGLELNAYERRGRELLDRLDVRHRAPLVDLAIDRLCLDRTDCDRAVLAIDVVRFERVAELLVRVARAREYEQAAGRQINTVHEVHLLELLRELIEHVTAI